MTFLEIMLILFLGFTFSLMTILGDVNEGFESPGKSALTLFSAVLGDFDFGEFEMNEISYFGYAVMIIYLILGSLVLLNLLVAMMAV
mgnify:CR=1 FL=1